MRKSTNESGRPRRRHSAARAGVAMFGLALFAGMLFWTKLRLVHHIPRSAYADPDQRAPEADDRAPESTHDEPAEGDHSAPPSSGGDGGFSVEPPRR